VIRVARRPPGWIAPGPPPAAPRARPELWPADGEDLCHLAGDWRILQKRRGHRWSLDDLVTAAFAAEVAAPAAPARILDLGCGIGAVLLLLAWRFPTARLVGVEAQAESLALARRSIEWNGCGERCEARLGDMRDATIVPEQGFDLVTGTPPYLPLGTATVPRREEQPGCHLELRGGIEDYCAAAGLALAPGGRFVVCHSDRARVARAAAIAGLSIGRRRDVVSRSGKASLFAVYELAREPLPAVELAPLVVRDRRGDRSAEFRALRAAMGMPP
jgi:tRNA1Val (adenine37-N6)-methyltransferase